MIPEWAWVHTVRIEPFLGRSATGPLFGPAVEHRCLIVDSSNLSRSGTSREDTDSVEVYLRPGTTVARESRVTVRGREMTVVAVKIADGGGLPTPDHVRITCN